MENFSNKTDFFFPQTYMFSFKEELIEASAAVCTIQEITLNITLKVWPSFIGHRGPKAGL